MKKLTVKEFTTKLRKKFPGELDNLDDVTLVLRWLKKYPKDSKYIDKTDALNSGFTFTKDNVVNWVKGKTEKIKDKITSQPTDTTKTTDSTSNSTKTTQQPIITPKPTQTIDPSVFNCIKNSRGWGSKLASKSDEPNAYSFLNDVQSEFVFFDDGKFYIQLNSGEKMFGTWKCKGQSSYEIEINNTDFNKKQYFRSETSQWADHQNAAALEENFIKKIVTKHLRSKL